MSLYIFRNICFSLFLKLSSKIASFKAAASLTPLIFAKDTKYEDGYFLILSI